MKKYLALLISVLILSDCKNRKENLQNSKQKILWLEVNSKTKKVDFKINKGYLKRAPDPVKAILAFYSSQYGTECKWTNGNMNEAMDNLDCGLTSSLGLGFQCLEAHKDFIEQWFKEEPRILKEVENCYSVPWTATSQSSIAFLDIEIKNDTVIVDIEMNGVNLRDQTNWKEHRMDSYFYDGENINLLEWKVVKDNISANAPISGVPENIPEPIYFQGKQCGCVGDTLMNESTTDCKTRVLKDKSKLYYQFNCDSIWLTLENTEKHVVFSMSPEFYAYTYRLGYQFAKEFDKYVLFRSGCPANGPCNFVLVDKQTGIKAMELGELVYDHGNDRFYDFLIYFSDRNSLTIFFVDRNEKFKISIDPRHFNNNIPEYQFDEISMANNILTLEYSYNEDDKFETNKIRIDMAKYAH